MNVQVKNVDQPLLRVFRLAIPHEFEAVIVNYHPPLVILSLLYVIILVCCILNFLIHEL